MKRPYYIASGEWLQTSMGFRAPFLLCHALNELGYEAYVTSKQPAPNLHTPLLTPEIIMKHKTDGQEVIAVYTEAMWGNVLQGNVVVRWIMNRLGKLVNTLPTSNDLFYFWDSIYSIQPEKARLLSFPCVDRNIFNTYGCENKKRSGFAYYAHKYLRDGKGTIPEKLSRNGVSLCQDIPRTHSEIAEILRSVKTLYIYEESALAVEATMCGCVVVLVLTDYIIDLIGDSDPYDYRVYEKDMDIDTEYYNNKKLLEYYKEIMTASQLQLKEFISNTQQVPANFFTSDDLADFCNLHRCVFIYGTGLTASVVFNVLTAAGIHISGFIVSDDFAPSSEHMYNNLPVFSLSRFAKEYSSEYGVVLAMINMYSVAVITELERLQIKYYNPVLL